MTAQNIGFCKLTYIQKAGYMSKESHMVSEGDTGTMTALE